MNQIKRAALIITALFLLTTCGIEDFYYLPQLSEGWFTSMSNTDTQISIPSNFLSTYYYATGYTIFYKIYLSDEFNGDRNSLSAINPTLSRNYNELESYIDPTINTAVEVSTFRSRGFYEIEIENGQDIVLSTNGGTFNIIFPTISNSIPYVSFNNTNYILLRQGNESFNPVPEDRYFLNSDEIRNSANATNLVNADVSTGGSLYSYVAMYICAVGQNTSNFSRVLGKPSFVNVFKLSE